MTNISTFLFPLSSFLSSFPFSNSVIQIKDSRHLIVSSLVANGSGLAGGLKVGDQIMRVNGVDVVTVEDLATIIEAAPIATGGALEVDVVRNGRQQLRLHVLVDDKSRAEKRKAQRHLLV